MTESQATVVVVDDDASVRRGLERLLGCAGYRVESFASPRDFLARGDYDRPGCLVLDVRMPAQSGLDDPESASSGVDSPAKSRRISRRDRS